MASCRSHGVIDAYVNELGRPQADKAGHSEINMTRNWKRANAHLLYFGILIVVIFAMVTGMIRSPAGRLWMHKLDSQWLGERAMDTWALLFSKEDWSYAEPLRHHQDYRWLTIGARPLRIAHALGESSTPTANTLGAMRRAYKAGFRVFEVDLSLEAGELLCQHDPGPQQTIAKDGCKFETLMAELPADAWVVLDIKSDFTTTGRRVTELLEGRPDAARVIFQLYHPEDFALFNDWQRQANNLPGPILTSYLAHRRIAHVLGQTKRLGVKAFTLPLHRLPALINRPTDLTVLVHPVHDCSAQSYATRHADGVYTLSALQCAPPSSANTP